MLIEGRDYFVRMVPFPLGSTIHGAVRLNDDGTYFIFIDMNATTEQQKYAYAHEIEHIENDDIYGDKDIVEIECALERKKTASEETPKTVEYVSAWQDAMAWLEVMMQIFRGREAEIPCYPGVGRW